jgi:hypothetical protein
MPQAQADRITKVLEEVQEGQKAEGSRKRSKGCLTQNEWD